MNGSNIRSSNTNSSPMASQPQQLKRKLPPMGGKLMRLRCRFRTLHETYLTNGSINENDADVTFITMDGQNILAHKIILCSASTLFSSIFADQHCGEMTCVTVPDVRGETMRLILQLAYTDSVNLSMKQIKEVGNFISLFGMEWKQFNFDGFDDMVKSEGFSNQTVSISPLARQPNKQQQLAKVDVVNSKQHYLHNQAYSNISAQQSVSEAQNDSGDSQDSDTFTFKLQGYEEVGSSQQKDINSSRLKQQLTAPITKPNLTYGRSPAGNLQFVRQMPVLHSSRSQNLNAPRTGNNGNGNNEADFGSINSHGEEAQKLIKEWMAKVGKEEDNTPAKRIRLAVTAARKSKVTTVQRQPTPPLAANQPVNTCTVCNVTFNDRNIWKWHEERHVGMGIFKCCHCPLLFGTCRKLIQHEEANHGLQVPPQIAETASVEDNNEYESSDAGHSRKVKLIPRKELPEASPPKPAVPRLTLIKSSNKHGTQYTRVASAIKATFNAKKGKVIAAPKVGSSEIGIGHSPGAEQMDVNKLKQLHWLYNCLKCDHCSDKSSKAMGHYYECYPDKELPFEKSVVKYRQGFYGKYRCPLCPRRYTSIGGFVIHCGHMHSKYRKGFAQTAGGDLKCMGCKVEYSLPSEFNDHLTLTGGICPATIPNTSSTEQPAANNESANNKKAKQSLSNVKKEYENPYDDMSAKRRSQTYIGRSPRSARLANRIINETLAKNPDNVDETAFVAIGCPICGADNITNINLHLTTDHSELGIEVQRLSEDLLRCRKCKLTFAICDLFSHSNSCTGSKEFEFVSHRRAIAAKNKQSSSSSPKAEPKTYKIPEGVGQSPIDKMDNENLNTPATLEAALKCIVCGKVARKLSVINECLKHHGIHRCAVCFNTYASKMDYSIHLKQFHGKGNAAGKLTCPICLRLFVNAGQVVSHMFKVHWIVLLRETKSDANTGTKQATKPQQLSLDQSNTLEPESGRGASSSSVDECSVSETDKADINVKANVPADEGPSSKTVVTDESVSKGKEQKKNMDASETPTNEKTNQNSVLVVEENNSTKTKTAQEDKVVTPEDDMMDLKEAETKTDGSEK